LENIPEEQPHIWHLCSKTAQQSGTGQDITEMIRTLFSPEHALSRKILVF
jgi:hypothetical protein